MLLLVLIKRKLEGGGEREGGGGEREGGGGREREGRGILVVDMFILKVVEILL